MSSIPWFKRRSAGLSDGLVLVGISLESRPHVNDSGVLDHAPRRKGLQSTSRMVLRHCRGRRYTKSSGCNVPQHNEETETLTLGYGTQSLHAQMHDTACDLMARGSKKVHKNLACHSSLQAVAGTARTAEWFLWAALTVRFLVCSLCPKPNAVPAAQSMSRGLAVLSSLFTLVPRLGVVVQLTCSAELHVAGELHKALQPNAQVLSLVLVFAGQVLQSPHLTK